MILLVTFPDETDLQLQAYQEAVHTSLSERNVSFRSIPMANLRETVPRLKESDALLFPDAAHPLVLATAKGPARVYAHLHSLQSIQRQKPHRQADICRVVSGCDAVFVSSDWDREMVTRQCPKVHQDRVIVSGYPFDPSSAEKYRSKCTDSNLVIFAQKFCADNLNVLETSLAEFLTERSYRVQHISRIQTLAELWRDREARILLREARLRGLQLVVCTDKAEYFERISRGAILISSWINGGLPVETLESSALGTTPLAPRRGPIAEFLPRQNLYPPYNLGKLSDMITSPPPVPQLPKMSDPARVVDIYCQTMEVC